MSDLSGKFTSFEEQSAAQHTELMEALNTIAFALGAPPTTPSTTLGDISTQLTALIDGIALLYSSNTEFYGNNLTLLGDISANTDTIINNNSLNAQRMLTAIYATFCACETTTPLLPPAIDVTPTELVDDAKCRRIQFYLSVFTTWVTSIANYGSSGAAVTGDVLATLLTRAGAAAGMITTGVEGGVMAGIPGVIIGAVVGLIVAAVYQFGGTQLVNWANDFAAAPMQSALLAALYNATNAEEGQTAFGDTVHATMDFIPASVLVTLWWSAWSNDLYSDTPEVDDSAFDGTICADEEEVTWPLITGCITFQSEVVHFTDGQVVQAIVWPDGVFISPSSASGNVDLVADKHCFGVWSPRTMWASSIPNCHVYWEANGNPNFELGATPAQLPGSGGNFFMALTASTPFELTICVDQP